MEDYSKQYELSFVQDVRIATIRADDAKRESDSLKVLQRLLRQNEEMYPAIMKWYRDKVVPGLRSGERTAFVAFKDEQPVVSAVLKRGGSAKFCHLKLDGLVKKHNLGELFFMLMAAESLGKTNSIHFTLPEDLWESEKGFFQSFGFQTAEKAPTQYRHGIDELRCEAPFETVWRSVIEKAPALLKQFNIAGFNASDDIVMSLHDDVAEKIINGEKKVEIRRRFSKKWTGGRAALYATKPLSTLLGNVELTAVEKESPDKIWETFGEKIGCSEKEFRDYVKGLSDVYAIILGDVQRYTEPVPLSQVGSYIGEELSPPQSYLEVKPGSPWAKALAAIALMHRRQGVSKSVARALR